MIKINELYFWEPCISPHKLDLINQIKIDNQHIKIYVISPLELPNDKSIFINDYIEFPCEKKNLLCMALYFL